LDALTEKPHGDLTPIELALYAAYQCAVAKNNLTLIFVNESDVLRPACQETLRRHRAYLHAHRQEGVWALLFLTHAGDDNLVRHYRELLFELADATCLGVLESALALPEGPLGLAAEVMVRVNPKPDLGRLLRVADTCPAAESPGLIAAIGRVNDSKAERFLCRMAIEAGWKARQAALEALATFRSQEVAETLYRVCDADAHHMTLALVKKALANQDPRHLRPVPGLVGLMIGGRGERGKKTLQELLADLAGHDRSDAELAERVLEGAAPQDVVAHVLPLADDPVLRVRCAAYRLLGATRDPRALPALRSGLSSPIPQVRAAAAAALKLLDQPQATPPAK
jgi:hypothetical protein